MSPAHGEQKNGITHNDVFYVAQFRREVFTWVYDIANSKFDGYGLDHMPPDVQTAAMSEVYGALIDLNKKSKGKTSQP